MYNFDCIVTFFSLVHLQYVIHMPNMFLQVDANGLHENGDILPAIILLRVKTACPENALNLLRGCMHVQKRKHFD